MTIVNDDSRVVNKLETSLTDSTRVIIYDRQMFIVQAHKSIHSTLLRFANLVRLNYIGKVFFAETSVVSRCNYATPV